MLGQNAEAKLSEKRVLLRITLIGSTGSGKTSLINALVNNACFERYLPTEENVLYYTVMSAVEEGAPATAPKFNTLIELEDTPGSDRMDEKDMLDLFDPWWPKPQALAMARPPRDSAPDKVTGLIKSVHLPFSYVDAPVAMVNDEGAPATRCEKGEHAGTYFCHRAESRCDPKEGGRGRQCKSCRRFQVSIKPRGQYTPIVHQRMAYIFTYDSNDKESYLAALKLFNDYMVCLSKKIEIKQKPLLYLVGTKIDVDPESTTFKDISGHVKEHARAESEAGHHVNTQQVSAMHFRNVQRLFKSIVQDLRSREPLWKLNPLGENTETEAESQNCAVQ